MNLASSIMTTFFNFLKNPEDQYLHIGAKPTDIYLVVSKPTPKVIQVAIDLDFGYEHDRILEMAIRNHTDEVSQIKWLKAIKNLKHGGGTAWVLDKLVIKSMAPAY